MDERKQFTFGIDLSRSVVRCRIPGEPQAWERPGRNGFRTFDTPANRAAKKLLRQYIINACPELQITPADKISRFGVIMLFATNLWKTDADNYAKNILDAVKGLVWNDDRQLDEVYIRTVRGLNLKPFSELTFYKLEAEAPE